MQKQKRITLNADKRKVIADVFQQHFEDNSKFKKAWQQAKETYNNMRSLAKTKIEVLVRTHQPQDICRAPADRKSTRLNSSHMSESRMPSSA